jgi:hypothetical protein
MRRRRACGLREFAIIFNLTHAIFNLKLICIFYGLIVK